MTDMQGRNPPTDPLTAGRLVATAMMIGVVLFWLVGWVVTKGGQTTQAQAPFSENVAAGIYGVLALAALVAAIFVQRSAADLTNPVAVLPRLIIAWALLEGPALLAGVCFMVFGMRQLLWGAAAIYFAGMFKTFPRQEWFANPHEMDA